MAAAVWAVVVSLAALPASALAHGVDLGFEKREGVEVVATFDAGTPMAGAQVAVFAPGEPAEPVMTGVCDENGRFFFVPDAGKPGIWEVRVRDAGHGGLLRVEVAEDGLATASAGAGFSVAQKAAMAAAVSWGFLGTALFFRRKRD